MSRMLVISDTHGSRKNLEKLLAREKDIDLLLHLGDTEGDEDYIEALAGCPCKIVAGNNDFYTSLPDELLFEYEGHRFFLTHGHGYRVSLGEERLLQRALDLGADVALFGHTHRPFCEWENGVLLLNPGSLSYPRQQGRRGTYAIFTLRDGADIQVEECLI